MSVPALVYAADLRVELIELPPDPDHSETGAIKASATHLSTLSERFAGTGLGRHFVRLSPEKPFSQSGEAVLYTDPLLLSRTSPAQTNVVVDLSKQRAYLMVGERMAMESEVCVQKSAPHTPAGFFLMSDRIKNGPISEGTLTSVPYWMKLGSSGLGIHGGNLYGYASAGECIRLPIPAAEILFEKTQEGTPVAVFESWSRDTRMPPAMSEPPATVLASAPVTPPSLSGAPQIEQAPPPQPDVSALSSSAPAPLRPVSGGPARLSAPPVAIANPNDPRPSIPIEAPASPEPQSAPSEAGTPPPAKAQQSASKPNPSSATPEIARVRNLFRTPANLPPRTPLFPADKRRKTGDANASHAQKHGIFDENAARSN